MAEAEKNLKETEDAKQKEIEKERAKNNELEQELARLKRQFEESKKKTLTAEANLAKAATAKGKRTVDETPSYHMTETPAAMRKRLRDEAKEFEQKLKDEKIQDLQVCYCI